MKAPDTLFESHENDKPKKKQFKDQYNHVTDTSNLLIKMSQCLLAPHAHRGKLSNIFLENQIHIKISFNPQNEFLACSGLRKLIFFP